MNKIRVCAFLALVVFIGSVVTDMFSGFMDGWNEAGDQKDFPYPLCHFWCGQMIRCLLIL